MKISKDYPDYKTARQWALQGYLPVDGAEGMELWANKNYQDKYTYYAPSEVGKATEEQIYAFFKPERDHRNAMARKRRLRAKQERAEQQERERKEYERELIQNAVKPYILRIAELQKIIKTISAGATQSNGNGECLVIDTETTGLDDEWDEILQLSIIDGDGNTLFDCYFKPFATSWKAAERVNGISPDMVANAPRFSEKLPEINAILSRADTVIGYNTPFDLGFLENNGVYIPKNATIIDVMRDFAEVYGEWSDYYNDYKWQKLSTAAYYYEYDWNSRPEIAHNSLADCYATLYVYQKMTEGHKKEPQ